MIDKGKLDEITTYLKEHIYVLDFLAILASHGVSFGKEKKT